MAGLLVAAAMALRVIYFVQFNATPLLQMQQWRQTDMHYYDAWARQIAAGDWRSAGVDVPMHRWHHDVAAQYFTSHPDRRVALAADAARRGGGVDADTLLWRQWMGVPRFYQDPLYAYDIAVTYLVAGADVRYVFAWQLAVGVASILLVWLIALRYFDDRVALAAAALGLLCAPLLCYELLLLRDSLVACTGLAVVWLTGRALDRGTWPWFGALGAMLGIAFLLKSSLLLLGLAILPWLYLRLRREHTLLVPAVALLAGAAIALAPAVARNVAVGAAPLAPASSGGLTFASANGPRYLPEAGFGIDAPLLAAILGDGAAAVTGTLRLHTPGSYASLLWRKWDRVWHWYEIPNNENFYYLRTQIGILRWLPVTFWLIGPLALAGLVLARSRLPDAWPLYALVMASAFAMVIFYVLARFRLALLVAVLPFAAHAAVQLWTWLQQGRYARALALAGALAATMVWTGRPLGSHQTLIRMADWILPYSVYYQKQVYDALDARDLRSAATWYLAFFERYEPDAATIAAADPSLGPELADMHRECAGILEASGQPALARIQRARAEDILRLPRLR